jgi:hypothetical protein
LEYSVWYGIKQIVSPPPMRQYHKFAKEIIKKLVPEQKYYALAGTNRGGYYSPYRKTMEGVKGFIKRHPGCSIKDIMKNVGRGHYANDWSARQSIITALSKWEKDWCLVKGVGRDKKYWCK